MRKILLIFCLFIVGSALFSLEFTVSDFREDAFDHVNDIGKQVLDNNADACAVLRVETDIPEELYLLSPKVYKKESKVGYYYLYVSHRKRLFKFGAKGYMPVSHKTSVNLQKGVTYVVKIKASDGIVGNIPVVIQSKPSDAEKFINGETLGFGETFKLRKGKWILELKKEGYKTILKTINVSTDSFLFKDLTMERLSLQSCNIDSKPPGASISINGLKYGKTPCDKKIFPGEYKLKIEKDGYSPIEKNIEIIKNEENKFLYELKRDTGIISFKIQPTTAMVQINGERIYIRWEKIELPAKTYSVKVFADGYYPSFSSVEITPGGKQTKKINLKPKLGDLSFEVQPANVNVSLLKKGKVVKSWIGNRQEKNILEGEYIIVAKANGYRTYRKSIKIKGEQTTIFKAKMEKGEDDNVDFTNSIGMDFVLVKRGTFMMGSEDGEDNEKPVHQVTISKDYYIGKYEVTQAQWVAVMGSNPSYWKGNNLPANEIDWNMAQEFIKELNELEKTNKYRLPTEIEWEFAARGGNDSKNYIYAGSNNIGEVAQFGNKKIPMSLFMKMTVHDLGSIYASFEKKIPVQIGSMNPNELWIYDMSGNVAEWCSDKYDKNSYSKSPESDFTRNKNYVVRGGSCIDDDYSCRVTSREGCFPGISHTHSTFKSYGLRIVREIEQD